MHHSNSSSRGLVTLCIILALALIIGAWYHFATVRSLEEAQKANTVQNQDDKTPVVSNTAEPAPVTETAKPANLSDYSNKAFGYTLSYPNQYQVKAYNDNLATIGSISGSGATENVAGKIGLKVATADTNAEKSQPMEDFIFNKAKLLCDADGRGVSRSCPRKKSVEAINLPSGLPGYVLTLIQEDKTLFPEATTTESDVTFYAVNIGTGGKRMILILNTLEDGDDALTKDVALSVKK